MWNFLSGYVMIQIEGKNLERLINRLLSAGVEIWNVRRVRFEAITLNIPFSSFYFLRKLVRRQGLRVTILEKHGLIVPLLGLRFRKVLLIGWLAVLLLLLAASRNIWFINVNGCDMLDETDVVAMLDGMDVRVGTKKTDVVMSAVGTKLMSCDNRIAWASASISGVVLNVDIKEAFNVPLNTDAGGNASIYAANTGIIKRVTALSGKSCVKAGDVVKKGDILITGDISSEKAPELYVRARGEVIAHVLHTFTATVPKRMLMPVRTGTYKDNVRVRLFSLSIYETDGDYALFDDEYRYTDVMHNCVLPLALDVYRCYELKEAYVEVDTEQQKQKALTDAHALMSEGLPKEAKLISKESSTKILDDGSVCATVIAVTEQNICEIREF